MRTPAERHLHDVNTSRLKNGLPALTSAELDELEATQQQRVTERRPSKRANTAKGLLGALLIGGLLWWWKSGADPQTVALCKAAHAAVADPGNDAARQRVVDLADTYSQTGSDTDLMFDAGAVYNDSVPEYGLGDYEFQDIMTLDRDCTNKGVSP